MPERPSSRFHWALTSSIYGTAVLTYLRHASSDNALIPWPSAGRPVSHASVSSKAEKQAFGDGLASSVYNMSSMPSAIWIAAGKFSSLHGTHRNCSCDQSFLLALVKAC